MSLFLIELILTFVLPYFKNTRTGTIRCRTLYCHRHCYFIGLLICNYYLTISASFTPSSTTACISSSRNSTTCTTSITTKTAPTLIVKTSPVTTTTYWVNKIPQFHPPCAVILVTPAGTSKGMPLASGSFKISVPVVLVLYDPGIVIRII